MRTTRRDLLKQVVAATAIGFVAPWTRALAAAATVGPSPDGELGPLDAYGVRRRTELLAVLTALPTGPMRST